MKLMVKIKGQWICASERWTGSLTDRWQREGLHTEGFETKLIPVRVGEMQEVEG